MFQKTQPFSIQIWRCFIDSIVAIVTMAVKNDNLAITLAHLGLYTTHWRHHQITASSSDYKPFLTKLIELVESVFIFCSASLK